MLWHCEKERTFLPSSDLVRLFPLQLCGYRGRFIWSY